MSTLVIDTIQGKTTAGSVNVRGEGSNNTNLQQGLAKLWINYNGTGTIAARDSFNAGTLTDHGTGEYTVAHTTSMASANYVTSTEGTYADGNTNYKNDFAIVNPSRSVSTPLTTGATRMTNTARTATSGATVYDTPNAFFAIFGDLA
mgnify:CR=1 FL=1